jgi:hypothetical protein
MIARPITYDQLKEAVKIGFDGDSQIVSLYNPNVPVKTIEDVQNDIYARLKAFEVMGDVSIKGIYEKGKLIGYYFRHRGLLISFALACSFRTRKS